KELPDKTDVGGWGHKPEAPARGSWKSSLRWRFGLVFGVLPVAQSDGPRRMRAREPALTSLPPVLPHPVSHHRRGRLRDDVAVPEEEVAGHLLAGPGGSGLDAARVDVDGVNGRLVVPPRFAQGQVVHVPHGHALAAGQAGFQLPELLAVRQV